MGQYTSYQPVPPSESEMPHNIKKAQFEREITIVPKCKDEVFTSEELSVEKPTPWGKAKSLQKIWQVNKSFSNPAEVVFLKKSPQILVTDPDGGCVYLFKKDDGTQVHKYTGFIDSLIVNGVSENHQGLIVMSNALRCEVTVYPVQKPYTRKTTWHLKFQEPGLIHYYELYDIYIVIDNVINTIHLYDSRLRRIRSFGQNILKEPRCMSTDHLGRIFIVDNQIKDILVFNIAGTFLYSFTTRGGDGYPLETPRGLSIDPKGNLYLTDHFNNRITVYSADGRLQYHLTHESLKGPIGIDICHETGVIAVSSVYLCWTQLTLFKLL